MSSFAITAATQQVTLDEAGTAQVSFTVANTSAQSIRARVLTKPLAPAKPEWLSLIGEPVRDLPAGAAEQLIVRLHVPPATPNGSYSFRLVAVAETAPDEEFAESPAVAFSVAPTSKKQLLWRILATVAVALVGAIATWAVRRQRFAAKKAGRVSRGINRFVDQSGRPVMRKVPGATKWSR